MKKFTFLFMKMFLFSFFILFLNNFSLALEFDPGDWHLVSENTTDGYAIIDVERYDGGTEIEHNLYLQVNIEGVWTSIWHYRHYTDSDGKNWYATDLQESYIIAVNRGQVDVDGDGDDEYVTRLIIRRSPSGQYNLPVSMRFKEEGTVKDNFTLTFYKPNAPRNLNVSRDICNKLEISWDVPDNIRSNADENRYYVYANGSNIGNTTGTSFNWTGPTDGTDYDIKVRLRTYYNSTYNSSSYNYYATYQYNYSEYCAEVTGNSKPVPDPPSGVTASTDRCDGSIFVQWSWMGEQPDNFRIARSTSETGTYTIISSTISGDKTYYEDSPPNRNTPYYYKIATKNDCGDWGEYSTPTEGIAADKPQPPTNINYSIINSVITVTWNDNSNVEENYLVSRTNVSTGVITEYEIDANSESFDDEDALLCQPYKYEIKATNLCGNSNSIITDEIILTPELDNTLDIDALTASKGYFADRVQLDWEVANNRNQLESFLIYRKVYGTSDSTLIATVNSTVSNFEDRYASNSIIYVYTIKGEGICNGNYVYSNIASDIGFKIPTGVVSGKVTYQNGNATAGVTVTAESTEIPDFSSIALNGSTGSIHIPDAGISIQNKFSVQLMVRFSQDKTVGLFNKGSQYKLNYDSGTLYFSVGSNTLTTAFTPPINTFVQISAIFDGTTGFIYINGELKVQDAASTSADNSADFIFGEVDLNYLDGYVDEIRLWNKALDTIQVVNNYKSYIKGNETGLFGYYRLNENVNIDKIFDLSKTGDNYNGNHGSLMGGASYSTVIPTIEQLWFRAITDDTGNYLITGIPYLSGGSNYKIIPMFAPHEFDPTNKTLYIGDGATIHNNIDFIDISTVPVSVHVFYENTNWGVKEVRVLVDGQLQFDKNNRIVQTNESGMVDLEVPIGDHYLSFEKYNHDFANPYFPGLETNGDIKRFSFMEPRATPIPVVDTTTVKLAGKIVGGPIEAEKDLLSNNNPTKNNLGVVNIQLAPEKAGIYFVDDEGNYAGDYILNTTTDPNTGYFEFNLLPEKYKPDGVLAIKNSLYTFNSDDDLALIDMTQQYFDKYESDSIFIDDEFSHMDTTAIYNLRRDWIKRSEPEFSVLNKDGGKIISAPEFIYEGETITETIPLAVEQGDSIYYYFEKPIFFFAQEYNIALKAFELYINADNSDEDQVPVTDGRIEVINELDLVQTDNKLELDENGEAKYTFLANFPNIANPFTRNLTITFIAGSTIVNWPQNGPYEAYIMGGRPTGNNFVTTGPAMVDYILRDPPGSGSNASLEVGHVNSSSYSYGISNTTEAALGLQYNLGVKLVTDAGTPFFTVQTDTEAGTSISGGIEASISLGGGYEQVHTTTTTEVISTSDDPDFDGRDGDVFVGHSTNIIYGLSNIMGIKPQSEVKGDSIIATAGTNVITKVDGLRLTPEFDTYFIYSQRIIEEEMLPHLKMLRDNIFANSGNYTNHCGCTPADPKYASKNDDGKIWGSNASDVLNDGPSYTYTPPIDTLIDSVRFFNNQIENWIAILAQNEKQKTEAKADANHQNISFGAGSVYESSIGSEYEESDNFTYEVSIGVEIATQVDFDFNGNGFELTASLKNTTNQTVESSEGTVESQTVSYTLSDQDAENYLTVDVLKCQSGNGPVFKTRGGQTSCPYEGEELTRYFEPGDHTLSYATMKIDGPQLSIDNPISPRIPETSPALFTLNLQNVSEAGKDNWYIIGVDVASNPNGAKVMMDGSTINDGMAVFVPYGETVVKTLEVWKGRPDSVDYENIIIYLSSTCDDISEERAISAYFSSACSPVKFNYPGQGWVINTSNNDSLYAIASGYNLQHAGFEDFHFQYTPTGTSDWTTTQIFTNDPLKAGDNNTVYIDGSSSMEYFWDMSSLPDRGYDIRLVSHCENGSVNYSTVLSGILDGKRPQVFGTPQPADGILNLEDDILVQFNEPIEGGLLTPFNFELKGTLNNYPIKHEAFLRYNGSGDYSSIPEGLSFNDKSFTIEFWVRPDSYFNSVLFSQGNDPEQSIEIGIRINGDTTTYFKIGNREYEAKFQFSAIVPPTAWQHLAYVFDYETGDIFIYQNDKILLEIRGENVKVNNTGKIYIGKSSENGGDYFSGDLHELRIWSKIWSVGEIYSNQYTALSGNEVGLYGYWPMDEAYGELAIDKAAYRHMNVHAQWKVEPGGAAWNFAGNNCLEFFSGYFAIIPEMDYTLEFWFKAVTPGDTVCLFSNQKGDGKDGDGYLKKALAVYATPDGKIWVASKGNVFEAASNNYFNNKWHHFALVVRRSGNASTYVDGVMQNEKENSVLGGIAGGFMNLGARKWNNVMGTGDDWYYQGKLDEFRLWNLAKTNKQIQMDMNSKLHGDEIGLMVYFPFEEYYDDGFGGLVLNETLENVVEDVNAVDAVTCLANSFTNDAPNIKDARPVEEIAFDWVASEDQIIVAPKVFLMPQLEKNILEITVEGVEDKYGNRMASPVTWTAYVHRNQVRWEDERRSFSKEIYKAMDFVSAIKNTGGQQIGFTITNLPPWLTANPSSGVINPESTIDISFTINKALNIGEYNEDIILHTENGFDEKLAITVRVHKPAPNWNVDPTKFEYTMNMVGKVKIEGVLSTDQFDLVAAFVNDSLRGVANVRYLTEFDSYLVFLNIYGNTNGEQIDFRIWDASVGQILDNVSPFNITFIPNGAIGTTLDPTIFEATGLFRQYIPIAKGWNWLSFNKKSSKQNNLNAFFSSLEPEQNDQIKTHGGGFNTFDMTSGWAAGGIDSIDNIRMYQVKLSNTDTLVYSGEELIPEDCPIELTVGWNHIGYIPDLAMDVNDALRLYVADTSEIIKSQYAFSMYDPRVGWLGTLEVMQPGLGYMLNVKANAVLKYPNSTVFKGVKIPLYTSPPNGWNNNLANFEGNMSVIAKLDLTNNQNIQVNDQMVLGAFINGENRGFISPISNVGIGYQPFFLNVSNNASNSWVEFRLFDGLSGKTYTINESKPFALNAVYGSTQNPLILTVKGLATNNSGLETESFIRCYPNPFNNQINIDFAGTREPVSIDILNATGSLISKIYDAYPTNGTNQVIWNGRNQNGGPVAAGIYYIRYISGNSVETIKISKTN